MAVNLIPASGTMQATEPLKPITIYTFPDGYQPENIRPRRNGHLLVTVNTVPVLYQLNPFSNQSGEVVHHFSGYTSLFGIVEFQPDNFYVIASNFTGAPDYYGIEGTTSILQVDFRTNHSSRANQTDVKITKVVDIPEAQLLDGFAIINSTAGLCMSGDAQTGILYLIDVIHGTYRPVLQDALLNGTTTDRAASLAHVGINGIKFHGSDLYFTNTAKGVYCKVPIDTASGEALDRPTILANYGTYLDDLGFDKDANQFISEPLLGVIYRPFDTTPELNRTRLLAPLYGANANAFGRTTRDSCVLYSTYNGAPAGVARIDTVEQGFCNGEEGLFPHTSNTQLAE